MSYRRHSTSKHSRRMHKRREKKRKKQMNGVAGFWYSDSRGKSKKQLSSATGRLH